MSQFWDAREKTSREELIELICKETVVGERDLRYLKHLPTRELLPVLYMEKHGDSIVEDVNIMAEKRLKNKRSQKVEKVENEISSSRYRERKDALREGQKISKFMRIGV